MKQHQGRRSKVFAIPWLLVFCSHDRPRTPSLASRIPPSNAQALTRASAPPITVSRLSFLKFRHHSNLANPAVNPLFLLLHSRHPPAQTRSPSTLRRTVKRVAPAFALPPRQVLPAKNSALHPPTITNIKFLESSITTHHHHFTSV